MAPAVPLQPQGFVSFTNQLQNDSGFGCAPTGIHVSERGKMKQKRYCLLGVLLMLMAIFATPQLFAQSQTTGDVTGVVTDQSGASVPEAKVQLKDLSKGSTQDTQTNKDGVYHFYLLTPGSYSVTVSRRKFRGGDHDAVDVSIGLAISEEDAAVGRELRIESQIQKAHLSLVVNHGDT